MIFSGHSQDGSQAVTTYILFKLLKQGKTDRDDLEYVMLSVDVTKVQLNCTCLNNRESDHIL